jgi:hypothetical protein
VAVITTKANGADVCFGTYDERVEAERVVEKLKSIGCPARIELARASDIPGLERRKP